MRIVIIGCGFHGRGIAYQVAATGLGEVVVADRNADRARATAAKAGVEWRALDVNDEGALRSLLDGATVVFNATGPYHQHALPVIDAAIRSRVRYVDMTDDHEVAEAVFLDPTWDERAKAAGVPVVLGCGIEPGLSGLLTRHAYDRLERPERVAIRFAWNYSRSYPAAIQHFLRINSGLAPQFIDGALVRPGAFAGKEMADFLDPVGPVEVYYTGVPDPVSNARFLPGLREATVKGAFLQPAANELMEAMVRWGMASYEEVPGSPLRPADYLTRFIASPAGERFFEIPRREAPMALQVQVDGYREGHPASIVYEAQDHGRRATTAVAALATELVARGEIAPGVGSPESALPAAAMLREIVAIPGVRVFERGEAGGAGGFQP